MRRYDWVVGERAWWIGWPGPPPGATCNPPAPYAWCSSRLHEAMAVTVVEITNDRPTLARTDDGFEFNPAIDPARLKKL